MKRKRFNESQIIKALKSHEAGTKVSDICCELGIVEQTLSRLAVEYEGRFDVENEVTQND